MAAVRFILRALLLFFIFLSTKPAYCEYNLATEKEENLLMSEEKEIRTGKSLSEKVEKKFKLDENYTNQEKVDTIGQKLAKVSDRKDLIYHFKVIDDDKDNAFALPGGYIYVFKGLLEKLEDEEIAAILAHEIGHICARHSIKRAEKSLGYSILKLIAIRGAEDNYSRYKIHEAINQLMLSYSREDEVEADRLSVKYLKKAGHEPKAVISVLDKLLKWQMEGPIRPKRYYHTHPYLAARRAAVRKEITGQMEFDDYLNVAPEEEYITPR